MNLLGSKLFCPHLRILISLLRQYHKMHYILMNNAAVYYTLVGARLKQVRNNGNPRQSSDKINIGVALCCGVLLRQYHKMHFLLIKNAAVCYTLIGTGSKQEEITEISDNQATRSI